MRCDRSWIAALVIALLAAGGCNSQRCLRRSDCDPGLVCSATGTCDSAPDGAVTSDDDAQPAAIDAPVGAIDSSPLPDAVAPDAAP